MFEIDQAGFTDLLGVVGFSLYAATKVLVALRRIHSDQLRYFGLNGLASALILTSLMADFNLAASLAEAFSLTVCGLAVLCRLQHRARTTCAPRSSCRAAPVCRAA